MTQRFVSCSCTAYPWATGRTRSHRGHHSLCPMFADLPSPPESDILERLERVRSEALDSILGRPFSVLDQGFIRVVDYMGTDASVVQAARISYGAGTKKVSDDRGLIRYLLRKRHTTPFEMCEIKIHVRVPMDAWRQWIRHRTANVNEYSTRYSEAIDANQTTLPGEWREQARTNRQGSGGLLDLETGTKLSEAEADFHDAARAVYQTRLEAGVAREQARKDLPLSTYTEAYWKVDLHNLLHFLGLRLPTDAQKEIRDFATIFGEIVEAWVPLTWEAFQDYRMKAISLSNHEIHSLARLLKGADLPDRWEELTSGLSKREIQELQKKLVTLGLL